jgi:hypothetical protein
MVFAVSHAAHIKTLKLNFLNFKIIFTSLSQYSIKLKILEWTGVLLGRGGVPDMKCTKDYGKLTQKSDENKA